MKENYQMNDREENRNFVNVPNEEGNQFLPQFLWEDLNDDFMDEQIPPIQKTNEKKFSSRSVATDYSSNKMVQSNYVDFSSTHSNINQIDFMTEEFNNIGMSNNNYQSNQKPKMSQFSNSYFKVACPPRQKTMSHNNLNEKVINKVYGNPTKIENNFPTTNNYPNNNFNNRNNYNNFNNVNNGNNIPFFNNNFNQNFNSNPNFYQIRVNEDLSMNQPTMVNHNINMMNRIPNMMNINNYNMINNLNQNQNPMFTNNKVNSFQANVGNFPYSREGNFII